MELVLNFRDAWVETSGQAGRDPSQWCCTYARCDSSVLAKGLRIVDSAVKVEQIAADQKSIFNNLPVIRSDHGKNFC